MICFVGEAEEVLSRFDQTTSRVKRGYIGNKKNGKIIIEKRGKELKKTRKDQDVIEVEVERLKRLEQAFKLRIKRNIAPEKFLVIVKSKSRKDNKFYSFSENGWLVSLPYISETYIQEFIATFFLNFEKDKKQKLKGLL